MGRATNQRGSTNEGFIVLMGASVWAFVLLNSLSLTTPQKEEGDCLRALAAAVAAQSSSDLRCPGGAGLERTPAGLRLSRSMEAAPPSDGASAAFDSSTRRIEVRRSGSISVLESKPRWRILGAGLHPIQLVLLMLALPVFCLLACLDPPGFGQGGQTLIRKNRNIANIVLTLTIMGMLIFNLPGALRPLMPVRAELRLAERTLRIERRLAGVLFSSVELQNVVAVSSSPSPQSPVRIYWMDQGRLRSEELFPVPPEGLGLVYWVEDALTARQR